MGEAILDFIFRLLSFFVDWAGESFTSAFVVFIVLVPLGLWKAVELVIWLCQHLMITWK